eukprot:715142-Rhodomonas_salina.1
MAGLGSNRWYDAQVSSTCARWCPHADLMWQTEFSTVDTTSTSAVRKCRKLFSLHSRPGEPELAHILFVVLFPMILLGAYVCSLCVGPASKGGDSGQGLQNVSWARGSRRPGTPLAVM